MKIKCSKETKLRKKQLSNEMKIKWSKNLQQNMSFHYENKLFRKLSRRIIYVHKRRIDRNSGRENVASMFFDIISMEPSCLDIWPA